jgi:hypothetical protein
MVPPGLSLTWEGRQELRFHGAQRQFPRPLRSAALRGTLGRQREEFLPVLFGRTRIGYTDIGAMVTQEMQGQRITTVLENFTTL